MELNTPDFIQLEYIKPDFLTQAMQFMSTIFVLAVGMVVLWIVVMFVVDISQRTDAIRRNFPVIGRFRYLFTTLGEFFRQYFFAMDREEMPFNRAQRSWVKRASKGKSTTSAFGSTANVTAGSMVFVNCPFPVLGEDAVKAKPVLIGENCKKPYEAKSLFNISGMSYGALSAPAVRALSKGAAMAGCWLNTGEGGLSEHHLIGGCDIIFQIGTAKYGVRNDDGTLSDEKLKEVAATPQVKMFELKLSQGAKPGKGGILPGVKVTEEIAKVRGITAYQDSISPNRHHEVDNIEELLNCINHIREVTEKPVGFKSVFGGFGWLEELCAEVNIRGAEFAPDFITIDSGNGGTGAAPMALMDNVGLLISESLPAVVAVLEKHGLRERIKIIAAGKLLTPADVAWALSSGADFINCARGFMFSLGCIQAMKCSKDTCPTGITTHNKRLQKGLDPEDKAVKVANYCLNITKEVETIAHSCGVKSPRQLRPYHIRIMQSDGHSVPMDKINIEISHHV